MKSETFGRNESTVCIREEGNWWLFKFLVARIYLLGQLL